MEVPMRIATALKRYLDETGVEYELLEHPHSAASKETAGAAGIDEDRVAKTVVLEDHKRFLAVMIPASRRVHFTTLHEHLGRQVGLATEDEVRLLFDDCDAGAVPGTPQAYGIEVLVDDALLSADDVYFESGSHTDLVHVSGAAFRDLMGTAEHGEFSSHH
jgi:Ala-tRNA(Pro) deacylase